MLCCSEESETHRGEMWAQVHSATFTHWYPLPFRTMHSSREPDERKAGCPAWPGLLRGWQLLSCGINGTTGIYAIFTNFTWEQMNVAHSAQTKRRTLSQQNTALEKASCFSSKPHILVELTNAGGGEVTGLQHGCRGQRCCCPLPSSPLRHCLPEVCLTAWEHGKKVRWLSFWNAQQGEELGNILIWKDIRRGVPYK